MEERRAARLFGGHAVPGHDVAIRVLGVVRRDAALCVSKRDRAVLDLKRHLRPRAARAALGDDLNDAVRGFGTIDGRRCRSFDDLDAGDVLGTDVVQASGDGRVLRGQPRQAAILQCQRCTRHARHRLLRVVVDGESALLQHAAREDSGRVLH